MPSVRARQSLRDGLNEAGDGQPTLNGSLPEIIFQPTKNAALDRALDKPAQVLVHEMDHVVGYADECDATRLEVAAMKARGKDYFENGYVAGCGIR